MTVPVAKLTRHTPADRCPVCQARAVWQVGSRDRSCDRCLAVTLRAVLAESDGFVPPLVTPVRGAV